MRKIRFLVVNILTTNHYAIFRQLPLFFSGSPQIYSNFSSVLQEPGKKNNCQVGVFLAYVKKELTIQPIQNNWYISIFMQ